MKNLEYFLEKFKKILTAPGQIKRPIIQSLFKITGIEFTEKDIEVKNSVVYINSHSLIKNEIYIKKSLILKDLAESTSKSVITDIR